LRNRFRTLLSLIQKSHFKSNNIPKLHTVLNIYRGLAEIPTIRPDVVKKVASMLLHPFPSIRVAAAETLFLIANIQELKPLDWSQSTKVLKEHVDRMKQEGIL
jgi:tubulin-specific chaperone D